MEQREIEVRINSNGWLRLQVGPFTGPKGVLWVDLPLAEVEPLVGRLLESRERALKLADDDAARAVLESTGHRFFHDPQVQEILEAAPDSRKILREFLKSVEREEAARAVKAG